MNSAGIKNVFYSISSGGESFTPGGGIYNGTGNNDVVSLQNECAALREALVLQQDKLNALLLNTTGIIALVNDAGGIEYVSPAVFAVLGFTEAELIGSCITDRIHPDDKGIALQELYSTCNNPAYNPVFEVRIFCKDGNTRHFELRAANQLQNASLKALVLHGTDITGRKVAESDLKLSNERYKMATSAIFGAVWDWDLETDTMYMGEGFASLFGYNFNEAGITGTDCETYIHPADQYRVINSYKEALQGNDSNWECKYHYRKADGSYAYVIDRAVITRNEHGVATRMIGAIQDITERKAEDDRLKLLESVVTNTNDGVVITKVCQFGDDENKIIYVNDAFVKISGYNAAELIGKTPSLLTGPGTNRDELARLSKMMAEKTGFEITVTGYRKNGTTFWDNVAANTVFNDKGILTHWVFIHRDVTQQKAAEQAILEGYKMLENYRFALDQANLVFLEDTEGNLLYVNDNFCRITKYTREELIGSNVRKLRSGYHSDEFYDNIWQTINTGKVWTGQLKSMAKDGSFFWMHSTVTPFLNDEGKVYRFLCIETDITGLKEAQHALWLSNERFKYATRATFDAIWDVNLEEKTIFWGEGYNVLFGYPAGTFVYKANNGFSQQIHPEDRVEYQKQFNDIIYNSSQLFWQHTYRYCKANGQYADVVDKAVIIRNNQGRPTRVIGAMQDITERVRAGKEIAQNEAKFRSLVSNINDVITLVDANGFVMYASPSTKTVLGYEPEEVVGLKVLSMTHEDDYVQTKQAFHSLLAAEGNGVITEFRFRHKNGGYRVMEAQGNNQLHNPLVNAVILTTRDITSRRQKEEERKQLTYELMRKNADLKQFSYIAGHNLRAPLTNLMAICTLLGTAELSAVDTQELIEAFRTSTAKLNETLNDLIAILLVKDSANLVLEEVGFADALVTAQKNLGQLAGFEKAVIHADFKDAETALFSKSYMESVLTNLLSNAVKFASFYRQPAITLKTWQEEEQTILTVTDNGAGMNMKAIKNKIFGLYQRFNSHAEGKGLGLYLVHAQVTALGGSIELFSEVGHGTTVTIKFNKNVQTNNVVEVNNNIHKNRQLL